MGSSRVEDSSRRAMGALSLAYVGDAVYELLVRTRLLQQGDKPVSALHRAAVSYVAAPAQAAALERMMPTLSEAELRVVARGRNVHTHAVPSGSTHAQYHAATALEALFGWLWLAGEDERIEELFALACEAREGTK